MITKLDALFDTSRMALCTKGQEHNAETSHLVTGAIKPRTEKEPSETRNRLAIQMHLRCAETSKQTLGRNG